MSVHEQWLLKLKDYKSLLQKNYGLSLQLPPPTIAETLIEFLEISPGQKIRAKLPFQQRFTNPVGLYQGGFLAAAIDDVFGPLSYITADRPCMTLSMNLTYLKAFSLQTEHCLIEAQVLQKTKSLIFMRAEVLTPSGDLMAHAESHVTILRDDQLAKVKV